MNPMKSDLTTMTPYILFFFGIIITYIGWTTKKILENIEHSILKTAKKVDEHADEITDMRATVKVHDYRIHGLEREVVEIRKNGRMDLKP